VLDTQADRGRAAATCDRGATPGGEEDPLKRASHAAMLDPVERAHLHTGRPGVPPRGQKLQRLDAASATL
jgi:hypothetical protein